MILTPSFRRIRIDNLATKVYFKRNTHPSAILEVEDIFSGSFWAIEKKDNVSVFEVKKVESTYSLRFYIKLKLVDIITKEEKNLQIDFDPFFNQHHNALPLKMKPSSYTYFSDFKDVFENFVVPKIEQRKELSNLYEKNLINSKKIEDKLNTCAVGLINLKPELLL